MKSQESKAKKSLVRFVFSKEIVNKPHSASYKGVIRNSIYYTVNTLF